MKQSRRESKALWARMVAQLLTAPTAAGVCNDPTKKRGGNIMADLKASALIKWLKGRVGQGYVYGTTGVPCTIDLLRQKQNQYGARMGNGYYQRNGDYHAGLCARWLGYWVADCSGLIKRGRAELGGTWRDVSAQGTYDQCSTRGEIADFPPVPGCAVFMWSASRRRIGHVGVYLGDGKVVEARGVRYGVVVTNLKERAWGYWGLLDWLDYDLDAEDGTTLPGEGAEDDCGDGSNPKPDDDPPGTGLPQQVRRGDRGSAVRQAQTRLNAHGADPALVVDGIFGEKTDKATRLFQRHKGLSADGIIGPKTWRALLARPDPEEKPLPDCPMLRRGSRGATVKSLQELLNRRGETLALDGIFGPKTEAAVKRFQRSAGLTNDGVVGPRTWAALLQGQ